MLEADDKGLEDQIDQLRESLYEILHSFEQTKREIADIRLRSVIL